MERELLELAAKAVDYIDDAYRHIESIRDFQRELSSLEDAALAKGE